MAAVGGGKFGAILFITVGIFALLIGAWQGVQAMRFAARAVAATGHVVAVPGQESPTMSSAHPMIEFPVGDAIMRYRQDGMGSRPIGTAVDLLYDPAAPAETAVVRGFWNQWFPVVAPIFLGLAFIAAPLLGIGIGLRGARP